MTEQLAMPGAEPRGQRAICDVFIDLTGADLDRPTVDDYLDRLVRATGFATAARYLTLALPDDDEPPTMVEGLQVDAGRGQRPTELLARAITRAAALHRHLIVLLGPVVPSTDVLYALIEAFDHDPMFGTAQPRFADDRSDHIWPLPGTTDREWATPSTSRTVMPVLPGTTITPELLGACMVLNWHLLVGTDVVDQGYGGTAGALLHLLCKARRRGMRNVVVNRAVVSSLVRYEALYPVLPDADLARLRGAYPDSALAEAEIEGLSQRRLEPLLTAAHPARGQRRILLDCRSMGPYYNGSTQCVLGFLDGFAALDCASQIDLLVWPHVAKFHHLAQRYSAFGRMNEHPTREYFAAINLTHPWSLASVAQLHRHALLIVFTMLDTIGWDVLYTDGATTVGPVWRFIARHADGLLYISQFTRERFNTRFPLSPGVAEQVTHLSLRQDDHVDPAVQTERVSDHILLFGNEFDHKDIRPTLRVLVDAFPFNRIVTFGINEVVAPNVVAIPSGQVDRTEVQRLIASARVIVYPSYYEGFGLPVVEGLAYGRPVIVRRSPLWAEIAGWSRLPGQLIEFDDVPSLIESVGRALGNLPNHALPSGVHLADGASPAGWRDCAGRVLALLNDCDASADGRRWREREEALLVVPR
ncbi:MAG: glycosyltransferase [Chloroflexota bacterium]|nr:glycosyltransferase [Chloroflexota bacterium]